MPACSSPSLSHLLADHVDIFLRRLLEGVASAEHDPEVLAANLEHGRVGADKMLTIKLKDNIEEVVKVPTLDHLRVNHLILPLNPVLWRLHDRGIVELIEVELDRQEQVLDAFLELQAMNLTRVWHLGP